MTAVGIAVFKTALRGAEVAMMGNKNKGFVEREEERGIRELYKNSRFSGDREIGVLGYYTASLRDPTKERPEGLGQSLGNAYCMYR